MALTAPVSPLAAAGPGVVHPPAGEAASSRLACHHCGLPVPNPGFTTADRSFCCHGCLTVFQLLTENGLGHFYDLAPGAGIRVKADSAADRFRFLDDPVVRQSLLDFSDGRTARVTFHVPAIHCVACVWLLENLFRLHPGIGRSQVNFARREVALAFDETRARLSDVVALLASIGYEPQLTLGALEKPRASSGRKRQHLQVGIAGFAFGNIMLFSLPGYLGLDSWSGPAFRAAFGWLSLLLALPVLVYSASDYWRSAWLSVRQRTVTLDIPIALGLAALYGQSLFEIATVRGEGYLDSLSGLIFFLLCGRLFQQVTHERLVFDRDYKGFFPLSVIRQRADGAEEPVAISRLVVGDRLVLRHGELIPADARLVRGEARIDYSFVTGESEPVVRSAGDHLYAGGRQVGGVIEVETVKAVSQSYLTSLWNNEAFRKERDPGGESLTNRYSRRFTWAVVAIALGAAAFWSMSDPGRAVKAFTSVLIVACPCALALVAPLTHGTAQRLLARVRVYLKNGFVLERMAETDAIVFDKTGTLTAAGGGTVTFHGEPLNPAELVRVVALARHSTHPLSRQIAESLAPSVEGEWEVLEFREQPGAGLAGRISGRRVLLGSREWLVAYGVAMPEPAGEGGGSVCVALDGVYRGTFVVAGALRPRVERLLAGLGRRFELALLSGDHPRERDRFRALFGPETQLQFNQSPTDKLGFIRGLQAGGRRVMMVGDGLNDAGALRQSDVGVAVVERVGAFSPASDVILDGGAVPHLGQILEFARRSVGVVRAGFLVSGVYNVVGIAIAAAGLLSPVVCAILMPLSSISVVLFAVGGTQWMARRSGLEESACR